MIRQKNYLNSFVADTAATAVKLICMLGLVLSSCKEESKHPYRDTKHHSKVFQRDKYYRIYLPKQYEGNNQNFPVTYFFHGWGGRYKSDDNANLAYDSLQLLVDKYNTILVMWDGNVDEQEPRPYNVGNHDNVKYDIQMKDYFLELVNHIDSSYRTKAEKQYRGIIGFSMGGFMSYYLAGKYPDMVNAAVAMTGSPEFFVGYPDNHTLYPLRYAFQNLREVQLRFHNSTADELTALNAEVDEGARWDGGLSYEYWQFVGGHVVDKAGETNVFERAMKFVSNAFEHPLPPAQKWSHYDLYPDFSVYGYEVKSSKHEPGFINLSNVTKHGFGISTLKWLPDGPPLDACEIEVTTAPLYKSDGAIEITKYDKLKQVTSIGSIRPDNDGRLKFKVDAGAYEFSIADKSSPPEFVLVDYSVGSVDKYVRAKGKNEITLTFFNRSGHVKNIGKVALHLTSPDSSIQIENALISLKPTHDFRIYTTTPIAIRTSHQPPMNAAPAWPKLNISIQGEDFTNDLDVVVPVMFDALATSDIQIDDGYAANDSAAVFGKGNGDGIVNPGERIMVYAKGHKLRLYTDDSYVIKSKEMLIDEVLPAKWPDGFTLNSVIEIDAKCPADHVVECQASFETKDFMPINRRVHWTRIKFTVKSMRKRS